MAINFIASKRLYFQHREVLINIALVVALSMLSNLLLNCQASVEQDNEIKPSAVSNRLLVMTVVSDSESEGFKRFNRSIEAYGLDLIVLSAKSVGSSEKKGNTIDDVEQLDLFKKALTVYKNEKDLLIMMVDSENLIVNANQRDILAKISDKFNPNSRIIFSADSICWPDSNLASKYPIPVGGGEKYLSSNAFIGYASNLWELLNSQLESSKDTPKTRQLYYTLAYLDATIRDKMFIELDHKAELFQNLHSIENDVELEFESDSVKLRNLAYQTQPLIVHAKGISRVSLKRLSWADSISF